MSENKENDLSDDIKDNITANLEKLGYYCTDDLFNKFEKKVIKNTQHSMKFLLVKKGRSFVKIVIVNATNMNYYIDEVFYLDGSECKTRSTIVALGLKIYTTNGFGWTETFTPHRKFLIN